MSHRKPVPNKGSSSYFQILAKEGNFVLALENGIKYKVLLLQDCKEQGIQVSRYSLTFSPDGHKSDLEDIGYDKISQGMIVPFGLEDEELFVYRLKRKGIQWLTRSSFSDNPSDIQNFRNRFDTLVTGVDSSVIVPRNAVSKTDSSKSKGNGSGFKTLLKKHAQTAQQLIRLATEDPAEIQRNIMEMLDSDTEATFRVFYVDTLQQLFCRATKADAVGKILSNMSSSMLLAYLKSVGPEERAKAVEVCSRDNTKNTQLQLSLIDCLDKVLEELVRTITLEDCVIKLVP
jgi:hypothetical protein